MNMTMLARRRTGAVLLALTCGAAAVVAAPSRANGAAPGRTGLITCEHAVAYRPASYVLACGDGNASLEQLRWSVWSRSRAVARGVYHINDCVPYCAAGHFRDYPADVVFDRPVSTRLGTVFDRVAVRFGRPPGRRTITQDSLAPVM